MRKSSITLESSSESNKLFSVSVSVSSRILSTSPYKRTLLVDTMKGFFHPDYVTHHLKACTVVYRTIKVKTIILHAHSTEGATNQSVHMVPRSRSHLIHTWKKTTAQINQTGG
jgi:hypothetical protein